MAGKITTDSIQSDSISNKLGSGAPDFPNGLSTDGSNVLTYETATFSLGGDFTGSATVVKIGNVVTLTGTSNWTHASASIANSAAGAVPAAFRPTNDTWNVFMLSGTIRRIKIDSDGAIEVVHYDDSFVLSPQTDTVSPPIITYVIT